MKNKQEALRRSRYMTTWLTDWPAAEDIVPSFLPHWLTDQLLKLLSLSWIINEIWDNIFIFLYNWMDNAPRIPKMYNFIGTWWIHPKILTVKPVATLGEVKWNEGTTIMFVYLLYTKASLNITASIENFELCDLITLNYHQLPGKQHHNVCLSALYKNITNNSSFHWHSWVMVLNSP